MKYLATIDYGYTSHTLMFNSQAAALRWLDEQNINMEYTTYVEEYDNNWNKVGSFIYTQRKE